MAASLFFGYTFVMTACFFLLTGTVGYFSCQWFINVIYSSIKARKRESKHATPPEEKQRRATSQHPGGSIYINPQPSSRKVSIAPSSKANHAVYSGG